MNFLNFIFFLFCLKKAIQQCTDLCVCDNYVHLEAEGYICSGSNCDCDGTRMCSTSGYCNSCSDLNLCPIRICSETNYYQSGSSCYACDLNCLTCTGPSQCSQCGESYILSSGICVCQEGTYDNGSSCISCSNNCVSCTNISKCLQCSSGTYDNGSFCVSCSSHCIACSNENFCSQCESSYILLDGVCSCAQGTYDIGYTCDACSRKCINCSNLSSCYQCAISYTLLNGYCSCEIGTYDNGDLCTPCRDNCLSCSDSSSCFCPQGSYDNGSSCISCSIHCLECADKFTCTQCNSTFSVNNGYCSCPEGQFDNGLECVSCSNQCSQCSNESSCIQCNPSYILTDGYCSCGQSTYNNGSFCEACSSHCIVCSNDSSCTQCNLPYLLTDSYCLCPSGTYDSSSGCENCSNQCTICSNASSCSQCNTTYSLINESCSCGQGTYDNGFACVACRNQCPACADASSCFCLPGSYDNGTDCVSCSNQCTVCLNESSCSECNATYTLLEGYCSCSQGTYDNGSFCQACSNQCTLCFNQSLCTQCNVTYSLINGSCLCPDGTYDNASSCVSCSQQCTKCSDASSCLECISTYVVNGGYCTCPQETYDNGTSCVPCSNQCTTCSGDSSCSQCNSTYTLSNGYCICAPGTYDNSSACLSCSNHCANCSSSSFCSECNSTYFLSNGYCSCIEGLYDNGSTCNNCSSNCAMCSSASSCFQCNSTYNLSAGFCSCMQGTYDNGTSCVECSNQCITCSGDSSCSQCNSTYTLSNGYCICESGTYDNGSVCLSCSSHCANCSNFSSCSECNLTYFLLDGYCTCAEGLYDNGSVCDNCSSNCAMCSSASLCSQCNSTYNLTAGYCSCMQGTYDNGTSCVNCNTHCTTCSGASTCTECEMPYYLINDYCSCQPGTYDNGTACLDCSIHCAFCSESSTCTQCNTSYSLTSGLCACSSATYDNGSFCLPCISHCSNCSDSLTCQVCYSPYILSFEICVCSAGYYDTDSTCMACGTHCAVCSNNTNCLQCTYGYLISSGACQCEPGYYDSGTSCHVCSAHCASCTGESTCSSCASGYILSSGYCNCQTGYFDNGTSCLACGNHCTSCFGLFSNCTACANGYLLINGSCGCSDGFFDQGSSCSICAANCLSCTGISSCQLCMNTYELASGVCSCPAGTFSNGSSCVSCGEFCLFCTSGPSLCLQCGNGAILSNGVCSCPVGTYFENEYCVSCGNNCYSCSAGPYQCDQCNGGHILVAGSCILVPSTRTDISSLIYAYIGYDNYLASWLDETGSICPPDTWSNGVNLFINCNGLGVITINLACTDVYGNLVTNVNYSNDINFNSLSQWQIPQFCSGNHFLKGYYSLGDCCPYLNNLGLNDLTIKCSSDEYLNVGGGCADGTWTDEVNCYNSTVICGYVLNFQPYSSLLDNTATNDIAFYCCLICKTTAGMFHLDSNNTCQICDQNCYSCYKNSKNCTVCGNSDSLSSGVCILLSNYMELQTSFNDSSTFANDLANKGWKLNGIYIPSSGFCGSFNILGPFVSGDILSNSLAGIYPHYKARIKVRIFKIDYWNYEKIILSIDGIDLNIAELQFIDNSPLYFGDICGDSTYPEDQTYIDFEFIHSNSSMIISFSSNISTSIAKWGVSHISIGYYYCDSNCFTCSGPSANECLSCFANAALYMDGSCLCNDGFLATNIIISSSYTQTQCFACSAGCKTCTSNSTNGCVTCFPLFYFLNNECFEICPLPTWGQNTTQTCETSCQSNQYGDPVNRICKQCNETCTQCDISQNNCTKCSGLRYLSNNTCVLGCPIPTYGNKSTSECVSVCADNFFMYDSDRTCNLVCPIGNFGNNQTRMCMNACPDGMFANISTSLCDFCDFNCLKCSSSATNCLLCKYSWLNSSCIDPINSSYIDKNLFSGLSFTNNDISLAHWQINGGPVLSNYVSSCGQFYLVGGYNIFGAGTTFSKLYTALSPHYLVRVRFFFLKIDQWDGNFLIVNADNVKVFSLSFMNSDDSANTKYCGNSFPEAIRPIDFSFSHHGANLNLAISTNLSSFGSWGLFNLSISLLLCDTLCADCIGPFFDDCIACSLDRYLQTSPGPSICILICPTGFYSNSATNTCDSCSRVCRTCFGPTSQDCTSCPRNQLLLTVAPNFTCVSTCPDNFWVEKTSYTCRACDSSCLRCNGETPSDCIACASGRYMRFGICYVKCPQGTFGNDATGNCENFCPNLFYCDSNLAKCLPCDQKCSICFGSTSDKCYKCQTPYVMQVTSCLEKCDDNYYLNTATQICTVCATNCAVCSSLSTCQICSQGFYVLYPQNTSCVHCTDKGQKILVTTANSICVTCVENCQICASDTTCSVCNRKFFLASSINCVAQKKLTATLVSTIDPQTFLLKFSANWDFIFENFYFLLSLQVSSIDGSQYSYSVSKDTENVNTLKIFFSFFKYVNNDNVLSVHLEVDDSDYAEFLLLNKDFEALLSDYCPLPTTYVILFDKCINITYVTPTLRPTTDPKVLIISFSNNFGEIFSQYTNYTSITIDGYRDALSGYSYSQLNTIDDYELKLDFRQSITSKPMMFINFQLPPQCIYNTSNNLKLTNQNLSIMLLDQYAMDATTKQLITDTKHTTEEMNSATSNALIANNMIPSGASFAFRCIVSMDSIRFLRFLLIDYPPNVLAMFETTLPTSDFIPNVNLDEDPRDGSLPIVFNNYNVSIYIFNNCGNNLIEVFAYMLVGVIAIILMKIFFKKLESKALKVLLIVLRMIFVWNFAMSNALSSFMLYSFYTFIGVFYPVYTTGMGKFNLFFTFIMIIFVFGYLLLVFLTIRKLRPFIVAEHKAKKKEKKMMESLPFDSPGISSPRRKRIKPNKIFIEEKTLTLTLGNTFIEPTSPNPKSKDEVSVSPSLIFENFSAPLSATKTKTVTISDSPTPLNFTKKIAELEKPRSVSTGFKRKKPTRNQISIGESTMMPLSVITEKNTQDLEETKTELDLSSSIRNTSRIGRVKTMSVGDKPSQSMIMDKSLYLDRSVVTLTQYEKNSASKLKKQELVMEKNQKLNTSENLADRIGYYFNRKAKSQIRHVEKHDENPLDWRLNNDYREHVALKIIANQWTGLMRSFYCVHKDFAQTSQLKSYFILFDLGRQVLFSVIVIGLYDNAFLAMILINLSNLTYVVLFAIVRPFKERIDIVQNLINEVLVLMIGSAILYMAFMEKFNRPDPDLKLQLGWLIVFTNAVLIGIFMMRMVVNLSKLGFLVLKLIYSILKLKLARNNKVEDFGGRRGEKQKKAKDAEVLQQFIEIQNFLT